MSLNCRAFCYSRVAVYETIFQFHFKGDSNFQNLFQGEETRIQIKYA